MSFLTDIHLENTRAQIRDLEGQVLALQSSCAVISHSRQIAIDDLNTRISELRAITPEGRELRNQVQSSIQAERLAHDAKYRSSGDIAVNKMYEAIASLRMAGFRSDGLVEIIRKQRELVEEFENALAELPAVLLEAAE